MKNTKNDKTGASNKECAHKKKQKGPIERLHPRAQKVRSWFFSSCTSAYIAWAAIIVVAVAVLVWFFVFSSFGAPAQPVYEGF